MPAVQTSDGPSARFDSYCSYHRLATLPLAVLEKLFDHPLTRAGLANLRTNTFEGPRRIH